MGSLYQKGLMIEMEGGETGNLIESGLTDAGIDAAYAADAPTGAIKVTYTSNDGHTKSKTYKKRPRRQTRNRKQLPTPEPPSTLQGCLAQRRYAPIVWQSTRRPIAPMQADVSRTPSQKTT